MLIGATFGPCTLVFIAFEARLKLDVTSPAQFRYLSTMKAALQKGSIGWLHVPPEKRFLINRCEHQLPGVRLGSGFDRFEGNEREAAGMWRLLLKTVAVGLAACVCTGCLMGRPKWSAADESIPGRKREGIESARRLCETADSQQGIEMAIRAYEAVVAAEPANRDALVSLSHLYLLIGDAYAIGRLAKRSRFRSAMRYAEAAMYTEPAFRERIARGEPTWHACRALAEEGMEAMALWVNAVFYLYKEGQGAAGQVLNFRWVVRARSVMDHMSAVAPDWGAGMVDFIWGVYYLSIPERIGGDRDRSARYFTAAIEKGPDRLLSRWGRAKYFHVKMGNKAGFVEDLEWVLAQDSDSMADHPAWRAFFVRDAERMLDEADELF